MIDLNKLLTVNSEIQYAFHGKIMEADMREASLQISERFKLLPQNEIDRLKLLTKDERVKRVGCLQRDRKGYSDQFLTKLKEVRMEFIKENHIEDNEIISLHSDAIFINTKKPLKLIIDDIEFKVKHQWTSYIRYNTIEMFYNGDDESMTYKGMSDKLLDRHTIGLCPHILKVFKMIENYDNDILTYVKNYQTKYLQYKLPENCYMPFDKLNGNAFNDNLNLLSFLCKVALKEGAVY